MQVCCYILVIYVWCMPIHCDMKRYIKQIIQWGKNQTFIYSCFKMECVDFRII